MSTRRASVLLIALGLMAACVALAFAFVSGTGRTLGSAHDETAVALARSATRQGTAHAYRTLIADYIGNPRVPTHLRQNWWAGFSSIDTHRVGWSTATSTDDMPSGEEGSAEDANGNDVPLDFRLGDQYFAYKGSYYMREMAWTQGDWLISGLARWIEPGHYHSDLRGKPISFHLTHPVAASAGSPDPAIRAGENWTPDIDTPIYYDEHFARVATRAEARYRLRYAIAIDDLNGHILSNLVGPYQPPTNVAPTAIPTAADDIGAREVDGTAVSQWGDSFNNLVLSARGEYSWWPMIHRFRGLGMAGDWANSHVRDYQILLSHFDANGSPKVLDDWDRALYTPPAGEPTGRYDTPFPPYMNLGAQQKEIQNISAQRGPTYSFEDIKQAVQEYEGLAQGFTPFGAATRATATPSAWNDSYTGCPWQVNLPTASPRTVSRMLFAYLPREQRTYRYQNKYRATYLGKDTNTGADKWSGETTLGTNGSAGFFDAPGNGVNLFTSPSFSTFFSWRTAAYPGTTPTVATPDWRVDLGKDINLTGTWLGPGSSFVVMMPLPGQTNYMHLHGVWEVVEKADTSVIGGEKITWRPAGNNFFAFGPNQGYTFYDSYWHDLMVGFTHAYCVAALAWYDDTGAGWQGNPTGGRVRWPAVSGRPEFGTGTQLAVDTDVDGDGVAETPSLADSPKDLDRLFMLAMGEEPNDVVRPTTPVQGIYCFGDYNSRSRADRTLCAFTINNNIKSLLSASPAKITPGEAANMELVLNDMRLSFFGASPQYPDFRGIDFDGNNRVECSGYTGGSAAVETTAYGPIVAVNRRFSLTGTFVFQKSHFFRAFVRGQVFDELRQVPVATSDCETVFAIDPDGSLYDVNNAPKAAWNAVPASCTGMEDSGVMMQRWHRSIYTGAMLAGTSGQ